jgi:hypothetical protein
VRTNVVIDDQLMESALKASGIRGKLNGPAPLTTCGWTKEEESLLDRFGPDYEEYRHAVPWRFIPRTF